MSDTTAAAALSPALRPWPAPSAALLAGGAALLAGGALAVWQASLGLGPKAAAAAAVSVVAMGLWATAALPEVVATLLFFALIMLIGAVPPATLFSGFASPAFWLVLGGMVIGAAIGRTGLGARVARSLARPLSGSYPRLVAGLVAISYGLAFLIPSSMGRITLLVPITLAIADAVGLAPGRRGRTGLVLAAGFGTWMLATSVLTANLPNLVMAGAAEALYGQAIGYLPYLLLHAPVLGIAKGALLIALICVLFPDRLDRPASPAEGAPRTVTPAELRLGALLAATVLLWMTGAWHGVPPAWIGLAAAVACFMPGVGVLPPDTFAGLNFRVLFYVAGILGFVAVAGHLGFGTMLGRSLLAVLPLGPEAPAWNFGLLAALATALSLAVTSDGAPALFTALAGEMSRATGLDLGTVLMVQVIGYSTMFLPYQAPPILVAMQLGGVRLADAARLGVASAVLSLLVLAPLDYAWWRLLGLL